MILWKVSSLCWNHHWQAHLQSLDSKGISYTRHTTNSLKWPDWAKLMLILSDSLELVSIYEEGICKEIYCILCIFQLVLKIFYLSRAFFYLIEKGLEDSHLGCLFFLFFIKIWVRASLVSVFHSNFSSHFLRFYFLLFFQTLYFRKLI
jgi:hypothetical protein